MSRPEMNRDPITTILSVALLVSVLATAGLCYWYLQSMKQLHTAQVQMLTVNRNRALMQQFANHAMEYGNKNPAILPILESVGIMRGSQLSGAHTNTAAE